MVERQVEELSDELERISAADAGCTRLRQIPGIGPSSPPPSLRPSATALPSVRGESLLHGSVSCHGSIPPEARRSCSASASEAKTSTAQGSDPWCTSCRVCASSEIEGAHQDPGWIDSTPRAPKNVVVVAMANKLGTHRMGRAVERTGLPTLTRSSRQRELTSARNSRHIQRS